MKSKLVAVVLFTLISLAVFRFLLLPIPIAGGDYTSPTWVVQQLSANFFGWCAYRNLGFNCIAINLHYSIFWIVIHFFANLFHFSTAVSERIFWWIPFFILSFLSPILLVKKIFPKIKFWLFAPILYTFNTYVLMLMGGGQISGIGLGYSFTPLVLLSFIYLVERQKLFWSVVWSLSVAILIAIDPRIGFIGACLCIVYLVLNSFYQNPFAQLTFKKFVRSLILFFFIPAVVTISLHFYWILPTIVYRQNPLHDLGPAYDTLGAVKFFSFATFENALTLLHPNWPENIFGLTHFMRPEFLLLPFLIFSCLFFLKKDRKETFFVTFFLLLALLGAFLAKGSNDPFGNFYLWMFEKVPGFSLFRDSTKWYLFVALGYSMVLPFDIDRIYTYFTERSFSKKMLLGPLFAVGVLGYLLFLILPGLTNRLSGTFQSRSIPKEYQEYQTFLDTDTSFLRTFWVPVSSRYGQFDSYHPTIDGGNFLNANTSEVLSTFNTPSFEKTLQEASVKYVVIPDDSDHEIFINDRKYSEKQYQVAIATLEKVPWLTNEQKIGRIVIFSLPHRKLHFWLNDGKGNVEEKEIDPNTYSISVQNVQKGGKLVFSESYHIGWTAFEDNKQIASQPFDTYFTSFALPKSGSYNLHIRFTPQDFVEKGLWVSITAAVVIFIYLLVSIIF